MDSLGSWYIDSADQEIVAFDGHCSFISEFRRTCHSVLFITVDSSQHPQILGFQDKLTLMYSSYLSSQSDLFPADFQTKLVRTILFFPMLRNWLGQN